MRLLTIILVVAAFAAAGCSTSAQKGAGQGATQGAAIGAASGAATGAVAGSMADSAAKERAEKPAAADPKMAEFRKRIGDRNYATALLLAQCKHRDAIASAGETLAATQNSDERAFAQLIQTVAAEESGDKALAASVYPKMGGSVDKARADALEGVIKVQAARREHGLPACK